MTVKKYSVDLSDPEGAARNTIQMFRDQLVGYRKTTSHPEELEWEIRLYDYILEDPANRLSAYKEARMGRGFVPKNKREVVKALGWEVP